MLRKIDRVLLRVPSVSSAVRYYRDVLGLTVVKQDHRLASLRFADGPGNGSTEIVLHSDPDLPAEAVYYRVDDVRELYRRRQELQLTFISPPSQAARGYRATVKDPFGTVLLLLDRTADTDSATEDAKPAGGLFPGVKPRTMVKKELLIRLYQQVGRTADDLPYTPEFEAIFIPYSAAHGDAAPDRAEVWRHLLNLRKAGQLPKLGEAKSRPPDLPEELRLKLREALGDDIGKRDRLPYTDRFNRLVDDFNRQLPRPLSPHHIWRLVATLAK